MTGSRDDEIVAGPREDGSSATDTEATAEPLAVDDPVDAARGTIYGTLASLFTDPDQEQYETLADGQLGRDLEVLLEHAGLDLTVPPMVPVDDHELLSARFNDVFEVGYPEPPVSLYESDHVTDGQWDDVNLDLARVYDFFGVGIDEAERDHHDHLQLELEFAGYLARLAAATDDEGVRRARRDFLDRHLGPFVEAVDDALADEVETGIYGDVVAFTRAFVTAELEDLDSTLDTEVSPA